MVDFQDPSYLKDGNNRQKSAYHTLIDCGIFEKIASFNPILTGTIPINIDIPESDLDIICYWENIEHFIASLEKSFCKEQNFNLRKQIINGQKTVIVNFWIDDFQIEIFGQNIPTIAQNAYRHLLIEYQILREKGESFRQKVLALKKEGYKTEPAFTKLLGLDGNPYISLLNYKSHDF